MKYPVTQTYLIRLSTSLVDLLHLHCEHQRDLRERPILGMQQEPGAHPQNLEYQLHHQPLQERQ